MEPEALTFEVVVGSGAVTMAAWWYAARTRPAPSPVLVCLPGGTYDHGYFDLDVPGHDGYSFARAAAGRGVPVLAVDHLGTGASDRPAAEVHLADQADAVAAVLDQLPARVGRGGPFVAVGHSMGGYVAMLQQARHGSYDALAVLGTTNGPVAPLGLPPEVVAAATTLEGRAALVEQFLAGIPERYVEAPRDAMGSWFHLDDVPAEVVQADDASTLTCVPRACAAESTVPGVTAEAAAAVTVPVLLAYGDTDVSLDPHAEPGAFRSSRDVTLLVLAGSGHCHNMAADRHRLWGRLFSWCESVVGAPG
jgi:pimeloyl-ACP methyl ester carboxylesterase